ncbi:helix-turn-helix domain-containing protein [Oceanobacillus sp. 143]|uniref:Resolvase HTH domain-containing protein n=1 Tax=Oceanobacillus zhaokaii TaxID=2052660 RepID=A0A345PDS6_9BACI|nr:helix-turn-helix domain-containing protein [Oceanobacillus zhaokaii]AXI08156.1 hypothetical protein CUC15_03875 [Oceanobacillus zhaokaii]QGS68101.1 helix-turn-helix domain-containing protein [Oceanobacillus sp. 143]
MARNKNKLKKRKKRYLKKQFKQSVKRIGLNVTNKLLLNPDDLERVIPVTPPRTDLFLGKYEAENQAYQQELDQVYNGTVAPKERFINQNASLLHVCSECKSEFFSKPLYLLTKENQKHVCGLDNSRVSPEKIKRRITEKDKKEMVELFKQGLTKSKIATHLGVSRPTVIKYLRQVGL